MILQRFMECLAGIREQNSSCHHLAATLKPPVYLYCCVAEYETGGGLPIGPDGCMNRLNERSLHSVSHWGWKGETRCSFSHQTPVSAQLPGLCRAAREAVTVLLRTVCPPSHLLLIAGEMTEQWTSIGPFCLAQPLLMILFASNRINKPNKQESQPQLQLSTCFCSILLSPAPFARPPFCVPLSTTMRG